MFIYSAKKIVEFYATLKHTFIEKSLILNQHLVHLTQLCGFTIVIYRRTPLYNF
jgi:hypothetical protein